MRHNPFDRDKHRYVSSSKPSMYYIWDPRYKQIIMGYCNFLSVVMLKGRFEALNIILVCLKYAIGLHSAEHSPTELNVLINISKRSRVPDFQNHLNPKFIKL